jgi:PBSX family phage portal protein
MAKRVRKTLDEAASLPTINSRLVSFTVKRNDVSRQVDYKSPFDVLGDPIEAGLLPPPYDPERIATVIEKSNILPQCIDCMVTNIAMYGYEVVPAPGYAEGDPGETLFLQSFVDQANTVQNLMEVNEARVRDYERVGYCYLEIIRNRNKQVSMLRHAPVFHTRMTGRTSEPVATTEIIKRGTTYQKVTTIRRFRKFVQQVNAHKVYFKEFGDPRNMDFRTGEYETAEKKVPVEYQATEILHQKQTSDDPYGVPRWISQLPSILGSRESEEVNLRYFEDNTVPPMIISVSGGRITRESYRNLENLLQRQQVGKDRQHKILLIEAIAESIDLEGSSHVSFKVDKLTDARQSDGLFHDYDKANMDKVRSAFRLPPVLIGSAENHTYATANTSAFIAEMQVFLPERMKHDAFLNHHIINHPAGLGLKTVQLKSKAPPLTNPEKLVQAFTAFNVMGAITPRDAVDLCNDVTQVKLEQYPQEGDPDYEAWMDQPSFLLKNVNSDAEQSSKTQGIKDIESNGNIEDRNPEHGQE